MTTCLLCGKEMEPDDGTATDSLACDECVERNGWEDFNETKASPLFSAD